MIKLQGSRKIILTGVAAILLAGFVLIAVRFGPMAPVLVTSTTMQTFDIQPSIFGIGTVEAQRSYMVGPTAASRVKSILVDVGDSVQAGQLIAEMDPIDLDDRAVAARSATSRARHAIATANAQIIDSEARQRLATRNAERYEQLGKKQFFSPSAVETKQQEAISAEAQTDASRAALEVARQDLVRLNAEQAAIGKQKGNLRLRAPVAGIVTARNAEPGTTLVAGQAVLQIVDPTSLWVKTRIDQGRSGGLKTGLQATVALRSRPQEMLAGKVIRVELNSDSVTEEKIVEVTFDQIPAGVSLNEMAEITIDLPKIAGAVTIPNSAIKRIDGQPGIWVLKDGKIVFRELQFGARTLDGRVQVLAGLQQSENVVVHSARELRAEDRVKVVNSLGQAAR